MRNPNAAFRGHLEIRDVPDGPSRIEGIAMPYGVTIDILGGRERFTRGAFAEQVRRVANGERLAYLSRHGIDGGVPVAAIDTLWEADDGLHFGAEMLDVPAATETRAVIAAGIDGVSAEFIPGKVSRKAGVREHTGGVRLAGIASSYAPAYRDARVSLRNAGGTGTMPILSVEALTERRSAIASEISTIRALAEGEGREPDETETAQIAGLEARSRNVDALIADASQEAQRRDAERRALPAQRSGTGAVVTRAEGVYGPGREVSYFADLMVQNRDSAAAERMSRHRAMVLDLARQLETRAVESGELAGAYPTQYYPDLYIPDIAYNGPLGSFFAVTPITAPNPIIVPSFATVTGDTAAQAAENDALANVDLTTAPKTLTPKSIGGETIVSRQAVDGASPGTDVIIGTQLREMLMRDTEREIALVLEALTTSGAIADTAGTADAQSGRDLHRGFTKILGEFFAGAAAGGAGARMLPAQGIFPNSTSWNKLVAGEDSTGRPIMPFINPVNSQGEINSVGFQSGIIGGVPVTPSWAILAATNEIVARSNDARQWKSAVLDVRLMEREGPVSVVFAVFQYFGFAVLEPKGVRRYTYTDA